MAPPTRKENARKKLKETSKETLESITSEQILGTLRSWQSESELVDSKALLKALRAFRNGNFSTRLAENQTGIAGEIARAFNESVELNQLLLKEFERVGKAVGRDGKTGQRVSMSAATGAWAGYVDAYNTTIDGLVEPVNEFGRVVTSLAKGDLSEPMALELEGRPLRGEFLRLAKITNSMIEVLNGFASEVTRVAREVGTEGILGGQAKVKGISGIWQDLTDTVNTMASNLTLQVRNIAEVTTAVAEGDLNKKITIDVKGEVLQLKETINGMVDQLRDFSSEVTRVAQEVGTDGKLGGQANVRGVSGVWLELTTNVNTLANNLTTQVRDIAKVATAVANGDLGQKITVEVRGEILTLKDTINGMVDQLAQFADQVTNVAREVGTEGQLGGQAKVKGLSGTWEDLTDNVNIMADNLTAQVRDVAKVTKAVAMGDLNQKITVEGKGEILELKEIINGMVEQLRSFSSEVTRVAQEVGTDGILGGQAQVKGVAGTWADLTGSVNTMAGNLTAQVRDIAQVATAVSQGDLEKKVTVEVKGEVQALKDTINTMVDQLSQFASEVTRVAQEVGSEGQLGGQAEVKGVAGTWADLTGSVNTMASNLTAQVRDIAEVTTAVANGNLEQKITVEVKGEVLALKNTINTMVDQLSQFASEVTRVAQEVGSDGLLGGQANVKGVAGTWADLTASVNTMADNLTTQVRDIANVATAVAKGDLEQKITVEVRGEVQALKETINTMVDQLSQFASEVTRVAQEVGSEGQLGGQAEVKGVAGTWADLTGSVNTMASNLTAQVRDIAEVTTAVANGNLEQKITVEVKGEVLALKNTINTMVDQLSQFASEVTRVAQEVGSDGLLGGQANVKGVAGTWADLTGSVNTMANSLTAQVRDIAQVTTAVANGDLEKKITVDAKGEVLELKNTINTMTEKLALFAEQVTLVAREVGTEGKLGGKAEVKGVGGVWRDLTDNVNTLADNLTSQVRNIAEVTKAVAAGDLTQKITVDVKGEILELKSTVNTMVEQLAQFASEVTRVAQEVGSEGQLGGQAEVKGVAGTWADLTGSVNTMASNLTAQVRDIAEVTTAVANGDLEKKITVEVKGEVQALKETINIMVDQLAQFASEVTRVAQEVGSEGQLGGQAQVKGVAGTWADLTDSVNTMANSLTAQVRDIAQVTTAVANGDLEKKITVDAKGEVLELKNTINTMTDKLALFAEQVTLVAREVGTEGKLGGKAEVAGVGGVWRDLTNNVNTLADNLTTQVRDIANVATAVAKGDLDQKITVEVRGEVQALKETINTMVDQLSQFASEVTRVAQEVGSEGQLGGQAEVKGVAGTWADLTGSVNTMASNLTGQVRDIAQVTAAVAKGDLEKKITVEVKGEVQALKETINTMVDQLSQFASEVTRVAQEVGSEGKLGGQAEVKDVAGTWADLTGSVNTMANNLTAQVRDIANVATAVANGDLEKKITVEAKGEVLELKNTINTMTNTLAAFSGQVTTVAREVGTDGKLGGKAEVPGVRGVWKDLTENVNELADNLTRQVRAIIDVVAAVTQGDFTGAITVEAKGEVNALKSNINQMITTLKDTTDTNTQQDWLKSNLAKFSELMQGNKDLHSLAEVLINELCAVISAQHGVFYALDRGTDDKPKEPELRLLASYAYKERKQVSSAFLIGQGLVGQCGVEKKRILVHDVPDDYIKINSGLGEASPLNIVVLPVLFEGNLIAVVELASFDAFNGNQLDFLDQMMVSVGIVSNAVIASTRTEILLKDSQAMAEELQTQQEELQQSNEKLEAQAKTLKESENQLQRQQEELQQTNEELEEKSVVLSDQKAEVEVKNQEVEQAKQALEEKAAQLALTSKYKSQFLANMSHELRTPLNSLLVLSENLSKNQEENLTENQIKKINTVYGAGTELLDLISEILDLAKIESGKMAIDISDILFKRLQDWTKRSFQQMAKNKGLRFDITLDKGLAKFIRTDEKRLQQVIKNLLSNAFKFTEKGSVTLAIGEASEGWEPDHPVLSEAPKVIAFRVTDTGIGIAPDKQQIIFEAFQQADGTTSRQYGGTGLGLSITREIAQMLGADISLDSTLGKGSTFTFFIPQDYLAPQTIEPIQATFQQPGTALLENNTETPEDKIAEASQDALQGSLQGSLQEKDIHSSAREIDDDRGDIQENDRTVLIIEDDVKFAQVLLDMTRDQGFKGVVAVTGDDGLVCAQEYKPDAIILDIRLPVMSGWTVMDRIKHDPQIRHIPIHTTSIDDVRQRSIKSGALSFLQKPTDEKAIKHVFTSIKEFHKKGLRQLLIIEDDETQRNALIELIGNGDVKVTAVENAKQALATLSKQHYDCMVLDLMLPDMSGFELIERIKKIPQLINLPIIIYTGKELSAEEETQLNAVAETIIIKDVRSPERLLDETALFLHRVESKLPESKRKVLQRAYESDPILEGRKILIVDDDVRNIYALNTIFEGHHSVTLYAESGRQAIETLNQHADIEIILMDIMMPDMDGYETMRAIRKMQKFKDLPIIAVTAKAMKEDRQKCIDAGASDYIVKPIDTKQLLSLVRVWLYK